MTPKITDAQLEMWLAESSAHLDDNGFSASVMRALPPPARQPRRARRYIVQSLTGLALLTALVLLPLALPNMPTWVDLVGAALALPSDPRALLALTHGATLLAGLGSLTHFAVVLSSALALIKNVTDS